MQRFDSLSEAQSFVSAIIDQPVPTSVERIRPGVHLTKSSIDLDNGRFTNSYDLVYAPDTLTPEIVAFDMLTCASDFMGLPSIRPYAAVTGGGFFYLADKGSGTPRQLALNLSISRGNLRSLPVVDRETVVAGEQGLEVRSLTALGAMSINGRDVDWSGSLTDYDTDVKIFSNGNIAISHMENIMTGSTRVLDEQSRHTPAMPEDGLIDIGFIGKGGNEFIGVRRSSAGGVDLFRHDFVIRCPEAYATDNPKLEVRTVGGIALSRFIGGAFSAGPMLNLLNFDTHPINSDASLGSRPPFANVRLARTVLYETDDSRTHIRLFDGRPGSENFTGITPTETAQHILSEGEIAWGCFLDPGQTARLCVINNEKVNSYGNRHYLRWPNESKQEFMWVPETGRPVGNVIALY